VITITIPNPKCFSVEIAIRGRLEVYAHNREHAAKCALCLLSPNVISHECNFLHPDDILNQQLISCDGGKGLIVNITELDE